MDDPGGGARAARGEPRRPRWFGALAGAIGRATDRAEEGIPAALSIAGVRAAEWQALGGAADDPQSRSARVRASLDAMARTDAPAPTAPRRPSRLENIVREAPPREESMDDTEPLGTGLALSGGGIRSATFSLGVLQAIAQRGHLWRFDFLSTVSGGGYVGSWLSAWIKRDGFNAVDAALRDPRLEPPQVSWLRRYSNYLAPRVGLFTLDSLTLATTWLRNVMLNLAVLVLLGALMLVLPREIAVLAAGAHAAAFPWLIESAFCTLVGIVIGAIAIGTRTPRRLRDPVIRALGSPIPIAMAFLLAGLWMGIVNLATPRFAGADLVSAACFVVLFFTLIAIDLGAQAGNPIAVVVADGLLGAPVAFAIAAAMGAAGFGASWLFGASGQNPVVFEELAWAMVVLGALLGIPWLIFTRDERRFRDGAIFALALSGAGLAAYGFMRGLRAIFDANVLAIAPAPLGATPAILTLGPPALLVGFGVCGSLYVGLVGRVFFERSREWWGRLNACLMIAGCAWFGVFALSFYASAALEWFVAAAPGWFTAVTGSWLASGAAILFGRRTAATSELWRPIVDAALGVLAIVFAAGLVLLLAFSVQRTLLAAAGAKAVPVATPPEVSRFDLQLATRDVNANAKVEATAHAAPAIADFFVARLADEAHLARTCVAAGPWSPRDRHGVAAVACDDPALPRPSLPFLIAAIVVLAIASTWLAWRVDVNRFSLHNLYKNRLIRCYLGASHRNRRPSPFIGFDERDDLPLYELARPPQRPLHIVNTAMNLSQGKNLAWQERKAASFALSPLYCGFTFSRDLGDPFAPGALQTPDSHYRPTDRYAVEDPGREEPGFSLGMALATSGAAVSPAMGRETQPVRAFLLTLFNVRLGRWSPNPKRSAWREASPNFGVTCLLEELFGFANEERDFVYLSDGGHFENTALYELVRRRLRKIVCVDAGADPERSFGDLGNAIHKCRVDFGVEIDIDLVPLRPRQPGMLPVAGFAIGRILYPGTTVEGVLVVVKPTLVQARGEPIDVQAYAERNPEFPQQTTADQFFSESQFESYRRLGLFVGEAALVEAERRGIF
jgi:hypothetical protein